MKCKQHVQVTGEDFDYTGCKLQPYDDGDGYHSCEVDECPEIKNHPAFKAVLNALHDAETENSRYYDMLYNARKAVGANEIYGGRPQMLGNEESPMIRDSNELIKLILSLS